MTPGLFEAHLTVTDLDRSIQFFRDVLGFPLAHVIPTRQAAFHWVGTPGEAMLGLWSAGAAPQRVQAHVAFRVPVAGVLEAPRLLRQAGITPLDFDGRPTRQPVVIAWMPAIAVYFRDPDGHLLEYLAMLPDKPRPADGIVPWRMWKKMRARERTRDAPEARTGDQAKLVPVEPSPADVQYLEDRIYESNAAVTGIDGGEWLALFVRDEHERIVAGLCGSTWGGTCELRQFWIDAPLRGRGLGTTLLSAAEREARRRGCTQIVLATFSFQAPEFYARHGFDIVATIDEHPRGHRNLLMRKALV